MKISEQAQECLELLWIAAKEKDADGTSLQNHENRASLQELLRLGLTSEEGEIVSLTPAGEIEASEAIRRHRLAERLLVDVLVTQEDLVESRACGLEHALFDCVDESICTLLGHPRFCPHGKPIPPGKCCQSNLDKVSTLIVPLREVKTGQHGRIAYLQMTDAPRLQKLMAMGLLPGVPVRMLSSYPSFVFEAGFSQFAVDDEIAGDIYVRLFQTASG